MGANGDRSTLSGDPAVRQRFYAGTERRVVDDKCRVTVPACWRGDGQEIFFALPDLNQPCLKLVDEIELWRMKRTLDESTTYTLAQKKKFSRLWFSRAKPCPVDKQGRIVVPADVRGGVEYRSEEVVLVGVADSIELWKLRDWEGAQDDDDLAAMADVLGF